MGRRRARKDADKILSHYVTNLMLVDLADPLKYRGADTYKKSLNEWFSTFVGPIGYEFGDLEITAGSDVAFVHGITHMSGKRTNGENTDVWVRATVGLRKIDGKWLISHEHISVPFYMDGSDKAALDLKP
jgi:ketosteroid isomerase-like protein